MIREARRRAGLTQRQLAERLRTKQSVIARWEADRTAPTFDTVGRALRACGFLLDVHLLPRDQDFYHDWSMAKQNLALTPAQRLADHQTMIEFGEELQRAMREAKAKLRG